MGLQVKGPGGLGQVRKENETKNGYWNSDDSVNDERLLG
jgi:hypothetical protein